MSVSPKRPKGPPLNAMRAFEAAARHVSFAAAAEELSVTPGAISQHIKTLEGWAGTALFRRNAQGVALTSAGRDLLPKFTAAFDGLAEATHALRSLGPGSDFHIAALPSLAQLWLPRRLGRIRALLPHIKFSVTAMESPPRLSREAFDLALFVGHPDPAQTQISICPDEIVPVCAPSVLQTFDGFDSSALLHDQVWLNDWQIWSEEVGVPLQNPQKGAQFSLYSLAVEEAKASAGILMGHLPLIEDDLAAGTLVRAHAQSCTTGRFILLTLPHAARQRPESRQIAHLLADGSPGSE